MIEKLKLFLDYEQNLLERLVQLSEKQQNALVKYNIAELEKITAEQAEISKNLRQAEEQRINLLASWFGVQKKDAIAMKLSNIEEILPENERGSVLKIRVKIASLVDKLNNNSILNRLLANRARNNVGEMLSFLTNGTNQVCNVKI